MGIFSDRPTNRPPPPQAVRSEDPPQRDSIPKAGAHRKHVLELLKLWGSLLASVFAGVVSAYGFVEGYVEKRIAAAIVKHDEDRAGTAHAALHARVERVEDELRRLRAGVSGSDVVLDTTSRALYELYWFRVGEKATELEPNRKLHARARAGAQREFEQLIREGKSLEDAYRRALSMAAGLP